MGDMDYSYAKFFKYIYYGARDLTPKQLVNEPLGESKSGIEVFEEGSLISF